MKERIILIGGGGHCKACIDVVEQENRFEIVGIVDVKEKIGQKILGYEIIGNDDDIPKIAKHCKSFLITIGQIKTSEIRKNIYLRLKKLNLILPIITSPFAYVSPHSAIKEGTIVMHQAIINSETKIGCNCIINNKALIEHEVIIGDHCHISTGSLINGQAKVGNNCFIGSGSILSNNIEIEENSILGAGTNVVKSIYESGIYVGNPQRKLI
jgi:sugar O-acyltransferase (sialic acid O-acetyltransferase NeuD family)